MLISIALQYVCNMQFSVYAKQVRGCYIYNMYRVGRCCRQAEVKGGLAGWWSATTETTKGNFGLFQTVAVVGVKITASVSDLFYACGNTIPFNILSVPTSLARNGSEGCLEKRTCLPGCCRKVAKTPFFIRFTKVKINFLISKGSKSQKSSVNLRVSKS